MSARPVEPALRRAMVETCRAMNASGLNQGTSGNLSARLGEDRFLITPSGVAYDELAPEGIAAMDFAGSWWGSRRPSTEWRFHRDILKARPDVAVVLHAHSRHATALACLGQGIPAFHYMVAAAGGGEIACAPYATFGSQALSEHALAALAGRRACLLANHGVIIAERSLPKALALAIEVETLAAMYLAARQAGRPKLLAKAEMARVLELFRTYGTPDFPDGELRPGGRKAPSLKPRRGK